MKVLRGSGRLAGYEPFLQLLTSAQHIREGLHFSARVWWPIIVMWLLTFGIHIFQWGYGAIRAVLLIGIAALAATCVRAARR